MAKSDILVIFLLTAISLMSASCSSGPRRLDSNAVATATSGLIKNSALPFPLYLTDKIEQRETLIAKIPPNAFVIHTGHLLNASSTKEENEAVLESLSGKGIDVVNLSLEDFIIADHQEILFDKFPQTFLNSSVIDLNEDAIIAKRNIFPYLIHEGIAFIGLSDKHVDKKLPMDKFLVSDYALAILRARKSALKEISTAKKTQAPLNSFIIIHTIGSDIDEVIGRLPPNLLSSLAD